MSTYTFTAHLLSSRFNLDWSDVDQTYSQTTVTILTPFTKVGSDAWGSVDGTGIYLQGPHGPVGLEFEPTMVQRLKWGGTYTDVLHIDAHVRDGEGNVTGFDGFYIELGGTPLPAFGSGESFQTFLNGAGSNAPANGRFAAGKDFLWAESMALERVDGTEGNDTILGARHDDLMFGNGGQDVLRGSTGDDTLDGGDAWDKLFGGTGNDSLIGGKGNDRLFGEAGNDTLIGGIGRDTLKGGAGDDRLVGNKGADTFIFGAGHGKDRVIGFSVAEGDRLRLDDNLWDGDLAVMDVIMQFATFGADRVTFNFAGGEQLVVIEAPVDGLVGLHGAIDII